ncbi:MAG: DNA translocase FtsK 4TM domain-containing protein, partial [Planctomycetes bacterium]|nr:DNA translocase FtsK 4TM domain-containing protein [Planctomycetota bacterium]
YVSEYAVMLFGWLSIVFAGTFVFVGVSLLTESDPKEWPGRIAGIVLGLVGLALALGFPQAGPDGAGAYHWGRTALSSGIFGTMLTQWLYNTLGWGGTLGLTLVFLAGSALLLATRPLSWLVSFAKSAWGTVLEKRRARHAAAATPEGPTVETVVEVPEKEKKAEKSPPKKPQKEPEENSKETSKKKKKSEPEVLTPTKTRKSVKKGEDPRQKSSNGVFDDEDYELPPIDLLDTPSDEDLGDDEETLRQRGEILEQTLDEFGIDGQVERVQRGPVVTMYEMSLAAGTKVSRVESLADDLAIALKAPNVRIVAPLPGKSTIGIEVPNSQREIVALRELIETMDAKVARMDIPLFLGKDTAGDPLIVDLAKAPHLLLAGATGSGKSVSINAIISSILTTRTPQEIQLLLVDPKSVEFNDYRELPHLITPVLSDMKKAAAVLEWACKKMDERFSSLSQVGVRNITEYNKLGKKKIINRLQPEEDAEIDDVPFYMPHIVIIIDELGELMMVAANEVENSIIRLSQKARAVGIHLICATQRPSADVITGLIKANLPARIAFQVSSKVNSRVILDRNGAELLLGRGDLLMLPPGSSQLVRAQGTFVSQEETLGLVDFLTAQAEPQFKAELREYSTKATDPQSHDDELYDEAVRIILQTERGSVSLLQRRLSVGYSRAARLIDMMAEDGIVGPHRGSQAREVLLTLEEWEEARGEGQ